MTPFTRICAVAVPLDEANIDTNQLCPTRFNKVPRGPQYARILFHDRRFDAGGRSRGFVLDVPPWDHAQIIVAGRNFGCGSSRESAVYALDAFGIRCVIAPGFGDIFASNSAKNGLLTVELPEPVVDALRARLAAQPGTCLTVDLESQSVTEPDGRAHRFEIHPVRKRCLLAGLDDIARTLEYREALAAFEARYRSECGWLFSAEPANELGARP